MAQRTLIGLLIALLGSALVVISALADRTDIGTGGFGWKQITGVAVGAALAGVGAAVAALRSRQRP
jgi:hypothetical protein